MLEASPCSAGDRPLSASGNPARPPRGRGRPRVLDHALPPMSLGEASVGLTALHRPGETCPASRLRPRWAATRTAPGLVPVMFAMVSVARPATSRSMSTSACCGGSRRMAASVSSRASRASTSSSGSLAGTVRASSESTSDRSSTGMSRSLARRRPSSMPVVGLWRTARRASRAPPPGSAAGRGRCWPRSRPPRPRGRRSRPPSGSAAGVGCRPARAARTPHRPPVAQQPGPQRSLRRSRRRVFTVRGCPRLDRTDDTGEADEQPQPDQPRLCRV